MPEPRGSLALAAFCCIPVPARLVDTYDGVSDVCLSIPVILSQHGVSKVLTTGLDPSEINKLQASTNVLKSDEDIPKLDMPTGIPLVYEVDDGLRAPTRYYLGDQEALRKP